MYSFIFTYIMRMDTMSSMNYSDGVGVSAFAEYIDYVAVQSTAHMLAQIYAVCCFGAIAGVLGYMAMCVPSPEEVEARRRNKEILDYNMGFVDELGEMEERELTDEELIGLSLGVVEDETPFGKVAMTYSSDSESYWYYADSKNVPYMTLDAVARQFASKYDCKVVCVNYKEEWEKSKAAAILDEKSAKDKDKDKDKEDAGERDVFANFKSYNTNKTRKDSIKRRRYRIMTDKSNQFSHKGTMAEYKRGQEAKNVCANKKQISFSEFKTKQL